MRDNRGISLFLIVFLMAALGLAAIGVLTMGAKLKSVEKERITPTRLETVRKALQRYYLSHHDLPNAQNTTPPNTIPAAVLNLPQGYRFDKEGQFIFYNCVPLAATGTTDILGLTVKGVRAAAVLVAPGPDKVIAAVNQNTTTYTDADVDDVVVGVSVDAEAMKIAARAVAVLQAAARAYDGQFNPNAYNAQFNRINNDGDTYYPPRCDLVDEGDPLDPTDNVYRTPDPIPIVDEGNLGYPPRIDRALAYVSAVQELASPPTNICIKFGKLDNDPNRGTATLDACANPAGDVVAAYGLSQRYITDPWGNPYRWGSAAQYGGLAATDTNAAEDALRDRRYWAFYSMGPDTTPNTIDDITPTTDRIVGFYNTLQQPPDM